MDKKKILIGLGVIVLIGGIFFIYNKSKNANTEKSDSNDIDDKGEGVRTATTTTPIESITPTAPAKVLETKKEKRKACGIEPKKITGVLTGGVAMINFKKRKAKWQACVDSGGVSGFDGDDNQLQGFDRSLGDFDHELDISL